MQYSVLLLLAGFVAVPFVFVAAAFVMGWFYRRSLWRSMHAVTDEHEPPPETATEARDGPELRPVRAAEIIPTRGSAVVSGREAYAIAGTLYAVIVAAIVAIGPVRELPVAARIADAWAALLAPAIVVAWACGCACSSSRLRSSCAFELTYLLRRVPVERIVLLRNRDTDMAALERTARAAWSALPPDSPNLRGEPRALTILDFDRNSAANRRALFDLLLVSAAT